MWQSIMSWLNPWQLRPYVVAIGPIERRDIRRRFMSGRRAMSFCGEWNDLHGEDAAVWYQYDVGGYAKVSIGEMAEIAAEVKEHAN